MPTPADTVDTVAAEKEASEQSPSPSESHSKLPSSSATQHDSSSATAAAAAGGGGGGGVEKMEEGEGVRELGESQELYENPFLKPAKRIRVKILN